MVRAVALLALAFACVAPVPGKGRGGRATDGSPDAPGVRPPGLGLHQVQGATGTTTVTPATPPRLVQLAPPDPPACDGAPDTFLTDVAACAGLQDALNILDPLMGATPTYTTGQAWGNFDGDPWLDLVTTSANGWTRVYLGSPTGEFVERPMDGPWGQPAISAVAADYDSDGDSDLFIGGYSTDALYENTGAAFVAVAYGPSDPHSTFGAAFSDVDQDGWLELYLANYWCPECARPISICDEYRDGFWTFDGATWTDRTEAVFGTGIETCGMAFMASWGDLDGDGDADLYVVNDRGLDTSDNILLGLQRNAYWINEGPGCDFHCMLEAARDVGLEFFNNSMGVDLGDYDNDGDLDLAVSDSGPTHVLQNEGTYFVDVTGALQMQAPIRDGWGTVWLDYDNDGDLDVYTAVTTQDRLERNDGAVFVDVSADAVGLHDDPARGVAVADYDRDGRLDLIVGKRGGAYELLRNTHDNANNWLGIRLIGSGPGGRDALGARVTLTDDSGHVQMREVKSGSSNGSGSDLGLHFGLGSALPIEAVVRWPDGFEEVIQPSANAWWQFTR